MFKGIAAAGAFSASCCCFHPRRSIPEMTFLGGFSPTRARSVSLEKSQTNVEPSSVERDLTNLNSKWSVFLSFYSCQSKSPATVTRYTVLVRAAAKASGLNHRIISLFPTSIPPRMMFFLHHPCVSVIQFRGPTHPPSPSTNLCLTRASAGGLSTGFISRHLCTKS